MKKKKDTSKMFIVRKYIKAHSVSEAIKLEKKQAPDDVYLDDKWASGQAKELATAMGFNVRD